MTKTPGMIRKEYAEKLFDLWGLRGEQFTIVEDMPISKPLRESTAITRDGRNYEVYLIRVSSGVFEKDMKVSETEANKLFSVIPQSITNFKGATFVVGKDIKTDISFIGLVTADMNTNMPAKSSHPTSQQAVQQVTQAPDQKEMFFHQLSEGIEMSALLGIEMKIDKVMKMADTITPGDAIGLITGAKAAGWIIEEANGTYKGTA